MKVSLAVVIITILAILPAPPTFADNTPGKSPEEIQRDAALQKVLGDIQSNDASRIASAISAIKADLTSGHSQFDDGKAVEGLLAIKKYQDVDSLCATGILVNPEDGWDTSIFLKTRIHALIAEGKPIDALSAAKSYYNFAPLNQTNDAITAVALCLTLAHPEDKSIARRFKQQQLAGSAAQPASASNPPATQSDADPSILASIKVDASAYQEAIDSITPDDYKSFVKKADLLLLADRPHDARQLFEQAAAIADDPTQVECTENIARAIRAESGTIGAANAYILSLRDKK